MDANKDGSNRRRLQFSLAGLLLFVSVSSIVIFVLTRPRPAPPIEGKIMLDGKPFEGATVEFVDGSGKTIKGSTDKQGTYSLSGDEVPPGNYKVVVRRSAKRR